MSKSASENDRECFRPDHKSVDGLNHLAWVMYIFAPRPIAVLMVLKKSSSCACEQWFSTENKMQSSNFEKYRERRSFLPPPARGAFGSGRFQRPFVVRPHESRIVVNAKIVSFVEEADEIFRRSSRIHNRVKQLVRGPHAHLLEEMQLKLAPSLPGGRAATEITLVCMFRDFVVGEQDVDVSLTADGTRGSLPIRTSMLVPRGSCACAKPGPRPETSATRTTCLPGRSLRDVERPSRIRIAEFRVEARYGRQEIDGQRGDMAITVRVLAPGMNARRVDHDPRTDCG